MSVKHDVKTVERATSPLVGSWLRDGDIPPPSANVPQFVEFVFRADGNVLVTYEAAAGALAGIVRAAPKIRKENDTYATTGQNTLHLREGTSQRVFTYVVRDGKLTLTSRSGGDAIVFGKSGD